MVSNKPTQIRTDQICDGFEIHDMGKGYKIFYVYLLTKNKKL